MSESTTRFSAEKVARLARLQFSPDSIANVQNQIDRILEFVAQIDDLDLDEVEPFFGAVSSLNPVRADEVSESVARDKVLSNAPDTDGEFYLVPPVFKK